MRLNICTQLLACLVTLLGIPAINIATAQDVTPTKYEIYDYTEPRIGTTPDQSAWAAIPKGLNATWASRDVHYSLHEVPRVEHSNEATIDLWYNFLAAFKSHLQSKEWFDKTHIAMDERSEEDMQRAYNIAHSLGFKVALAGNYHSSLVDKLSDICVAYTQADRFTAEELEMRRAKGYVTTLYTSCAEREPNIYSNSLPAETALLPIYTAAMGLDGNLHWSWINWDEHPLTDTRYRMFGAGDTYFYYPGNRPSIRFERLIEGIHQYEKIQILREEYRDTHERLRELESLLDRIRHSDITTSDCAPLVNAVERILNGEL